jgi:murein DD-endopeptidase MepM/ murein hydrolase activator NlpD
MRKLRPMLKKLSTPVTIMLVPHSRTGSLNFNIPAALLGLLTLFATIGCIYTVSLTFCTIDYFVMKKKYTAIDGQFRAIQSSLRSLRESEAEFKRLFSLGSRKKILEAAPQGQSDGSIDVEELQRQIAASMKSVSEIKRYLAQEQDIYRATPQGMPVEGKISSGFGRRVHPLTGREQFHSGIDISAARGMPVHATADGVVSLADWSKGNGQVVVIEHGHGFSTVYAHNSRLDVKAGQVVKRGAVIAAIGATGNATGPHVHYEVWRGGACVNPVSFTGATAGVPPPPP